MSKASVRKIIGGQKEVHLDLKKIVLKHIEHQFQKPLQEHNIKAFKVFEGKYHEFSKRKLILDLGSGTGESSYYLAIKNPLDCVVSIDRSAVRLSKSSTNQLKNLIYIRSDIEDFIRLFKQGNYISDQTCIFYPNPYPKMSQINKRWYAHPIFSDLVSCSRNIEVRSNWDLYIKEFSLALKYLKRESTLERYIPEQTITAFEKKYHLDDQKLYRLISG